MGPEHCQGISCMCPRMSTGKAENWGCVAWRSGDWEPVGCHWKAEWLPNEQGTFYVVPEDRRRLTWLMSKSHGPASMPAWSASCRPRCLDWQALLLLTAPPGPFLSLLEVSASAPFPGLFLLLEHPFLSALHGCIFLSLVHRSIKGHLTPPPAT